MFLIGVQSARSTLEDIDLGWMLCGLNDRGAWILGSPDNRLLTYCTALRKAPLFGSRLSPKDDPSWWSTPCIGGLSCFTFFA